jgi:hypothetical protein
MESIHGDQVNDFSKPYALGLTPALQKLEGFRAKASRVKL